MSEFTSGHLMLASHKEIIHNLAIAGAVVKQLDEKWVGFFTPYDHYLDNQNAPDFVYKLSKDAPVLFFCNFEDHFWGYRIFSEGREVAYLRIFYEMEEEIIIESFKEKYPGRDILELYDEAYEEISAEIVEQGGLEKAIDGLFNECNVEAFQLFGISDEQLEKLRIILNSNYFKSHENIFDLVEEFKECVGIEEMSWISHDRVDESHTDSDVDIIDAYVYRRLIKE